jgi:hypothetical protein
MSQHDTSMYEAYRPCDLEFNNNMSMADVFLDIKKAIDTTWHPGLLYKLSTLQFSSRRVMLTSSFLSNRESKVSI